MSEYTEQAEQFAKDHNVTMTATYIGHYPRFGGSITAVYQVVLSRVGIKKPFSFRFSTSIHDSWAYSSATSWVQGLPNRFRLESFFENYLIKPVSTVNGINIRQTKKAPSIYDILACLTKYDPGRFEEFCGEYGYDEDSKKAEGTYREVLDEWRNVERMFGDVLEELQEIC